VFVCLVTKAAYVALVADLFSAAFIAALRRFTALYSVPDTLQSDNGSNFVGANAELKHVYQVLQAKSTQEDIHQWSALKGVKWLFIPSRAPYFGGIWETAVRSLKLAFKRVVGTQILRVDE